MYALIDSRGLDGLAWVILLFWVIIAVLVLGAFLAAALPAGVVVSSRTGSRLAGIAVGTVAGLVTLGAYAWAVESDHLAHVEGRWIAVWLALANWLTVAFLGLVTRRDTTAIGEVAAPDDRDEDELEPGASTGPKW